MLFVAAQHCSAVGYGPRYDPWQSGSVKQSTRTYRGLVRRKRNYVRYVHEDDISAIQWNLLLVTV